MFLSEKQIKDYQNDGVIIVKDIFKVWIERLSHHLFDNLEFVFQIKTFLLLKTIFFL